MGCGASDVKNTAASATTPSDRAPAPPITSHDPPEIELYGSIEEGDRVLAANRYTGDVNHDYNLGRVLGQGQFGTTRLASRKIDNEKFACKTISKRKLVKKQDRDDVRQELAIMNHLSGHPNIVKLIGAYEDQRSVHIVMELCTGGELFDRIVQRGHYSEKSAAAVIKVIVEVVNHCHTMGVVHRDLKPENFMLATTGAASDLKAIDFGLSSFFQPSLNLTDIVGSAYYIAPEVLRKSYSSSCDIWSCGVILYILLCGVPPFYAETDTATFRAIIKGELDFESAPWPRISEQAKDCVRKMLCADVPKRATAHQVLQHPWLAGQGVASDEPLENEIQKRLQRFQGLNKLKRHALRLIASYLSPDEVEGLRNHFVVLDTDKNGTVTAEELKVALRGMQNTSKIPVAEVHDVLATLDLNASGAIDYEEFLAATLHASKVHADEHLQRAFAEFDKDHSGTITVDELNQALGHMPDVNFKEIKDILARVDKNRDGHIDYKEFVDMMRPIANGPVRRRHQAYIF